MTELYDQWIDAMKAAERPYGLRDYIIAGTQDARNADRLAAYKRKRVVKFKNGTVIKSNGDNDTWKSYD